MRNPPPIVQAVTTGTLINATESEITAYAAMLNLSFIDWVAVMETAEQIKIKDSKSYDNSSLG